MFFLEKLDFLKNESNRCCLTDWEILWQISFFFCWHNTTKSTCCTISFVGRKIGRIFTDGNTCWDRAFLFFKLVRDFLTLSLVGICLLLEAGVTRLNFHKYYKYYGLLAIHLMVSTKTLFRHIIDYTVQLRQVNGKWVIFNLRCELCNRDNRFDTF